MSILEAALRQEHLSIACQPIRSIRPKARESDYFEVLLRVQGGSPIAFLNSLNPQESRILDFWVASQIRRLPFGKYAINLSSDSLSSPELFEFLLGTAQELVIEVTEHHAFEITQTDLLNEICQHFPTMLDDIGSAYSGLNRLCNFKFDGIKIDGHLILQIAENMKARAIVGTLMTMAEGLGLCCVCEYVETTELWEILSGIHDRYAPGLDLYVQGWAAGLPTIFSA